MAAVVVIGARTAGFLSLHLADRSPSRSSSGPAVLSSDHRLVETTRVLGTGIIAGDCWDETSILGLGDHARDQHVVEVPCHGPHDAETVLLLVLPDRRGASFPGEAALGDRVLPRCRRAFERHVGVPPDRSNLDLVLHLPSPATWSGSDDREAMCSARGRDGIPLVFPVGDGSP
jgi:hypothetical protein